MHLLQCCPPAYAAIILDQIDNNVIEADPATGLSGRATPGLMMAAIESPPPYAKYAEFPVSRPVIDVPVPVYPAVDSLPV